MANAAPVKTSRPPSVVVTWHSWTGVAGFALALALQKVLRWAPDDAVLLVLLLTVAPVLALEGVRVRGTRKSGPFDAAHRRRVALKLVGLVQTWVIIAAVYWVVPFYFNGPGGLLLHILEKPYVWLPLLIIVPLYISLEDRSSPEPEDMLYRIGCRVAGLDHAALDRRELKEYALGWTVKAFFLPLMIGGCVDNIRWWTNYAPGQQNYFSIYEMLYSLVYFVDVMYASAGYIFALKLFDTHIRTSQPRLLGWLVALVCYPPFWQGISDTVLTYNPDGREWGQFFGTVPGLAEAWAFVILALIIVYVMATIQFGARFSNLTNRGIITNGPYRWLKHPAYLTKNLSWWMLSVPFLNHTGTLGSIRACILLLGLNGIYYMRAKTEEWHLSEEPAYRDYLAFMDKHGLGAVLRRRLGLGRR